MRRLIVVLSAIVLTACSDSTGSPVTQRNEDDLVFLRNASDAPPFVQLTATFWAVRGEDRELQAGVIHACVQRNEHPGSRRTEPGT